MRHALPLFRNDAAPVGRNTFGALFLDGGFVDSDGEPCRGLTLLLDFTGQAEGARVARVLTASILHTHGRWQSFAGSRAIGAFIDALHSRPAAALSVVAVLPDDPSDNRRCRAALEAIVASTVHTIGAVVAISSQPLLWSDLPGVTGHVACAPGNACADAATVFRTLAALHAPELLACFDVADIRLVLDTCGDPVVVVHGSRAEEDTRSLVLPTETDRAVMASAAAVAVLPIWSRAGLSDARRLMDCTRSMLGRNAVLIPTITSGFFHAEGDRSVALLCRPVQPTTPASRIQQ